MGENGNVLSWFELPVTDMKRATKFYEHIFDIKLMPMELGPTFKMAVFPAGEKMVGGALVWNEDWYQPSESQGPLIYFDANPDLKKVLDRVTDSGGELMIDKREIGPEAGYMGVFRDTEGNRVALYSDE